MATLIKNREVTITRVYDAPRELIWKAWTEPEVLKQWWGPKHFTAPVSEIDLRVGGRYLNCMRGPDGRDYWSTGVYRNIEAPIRLVMTDSFADEKGNVVPASHYGMSGNWPAELLVTVTLQDVNGKTKMTLNHTGIPEGQLIELTAAGWNESFNKLVENIVPNNHTRIIAEPGKQEIIITRVFDAPRHNLFKAYTERDLIPQWWGPRRFSTMVDRLNARTGGIWRFINRDSAGREFGFHGVYHEVLPPVRIVNTFEFEGMPGHVSLETCVLEEMGEKTKMTARSVYQTVEDRDGMLGAEMEEGVFETMDRLSELLQRPVEEKKAA